MALFLGRAWYDARLAERGLTPAVLAAVAGMTGEELALAYKDQRELTATQVAAFAEVPGVPLAEAARRAGVGAHAAAPFPLGRRRRGWRTGSRRGGRLKRPNRA